MPAAGNAVSRSPVAGVDALVDATAVDVLVDAGLRARALRPVGAAPAVPRGVDDQAGTIIVDGALFTDAPHHLAQPARVPHRHTNQEEEGPAGSV
jgi:hypothetical protein